MSDLDFDAQVFEAADLEDSDGPVIATAPDSQEPAPPEEISLVEFFDEIDKLEPLFAKVSKSIQDLRAAADAVTKSFIADTGAEHYRSVAHTQGHQALQQINEKIQELNARVVRVKEAEEEEWKRDPSLQGTYSPEVQQMLNIMSGTTKQFYNYCYNFQESQLSTKAVLEQKVRKVMRTLHNQMGGQEVDFESGDAAIQAALAANLRDEQDEILQEAMEKREVINDITKFSQEVHQMTLQTAMLAEAQSQMIERIAANVETARNDIQAGTQSLVRSNENMKKGRKCLCCALFAAIIALVILLLITGGIISAIKKKSSNSSEE